MYQGTGPSTTALLRLPPAMHPATCSAPPPLPPFVFSPVTSSASSAPQPLHLHTFPNLPSPPSPPSSSHPCILPSEEGDSAGSIAFTLAMCNV
eukprot:3932848-Rhodomonas_salina.1